MYPKNKLPTLIEKETVDHFNCIQLKHGRYTDRVVIPFYVNKELLGFCATDILGKEEWLKRNPQRIERDYRKVLYPSGFSRKTCLFNFDSVEKNTDFIIITEGARDSMKLWQLGYQTVSILGTSMSADQIKLIAQLNPKKVLVMLDGDIAGYNAQKKICKRMKKHFECYECILPEGHDPKTLDPEKIKDIISKTFQNNT